MAQIVPSDLVIGYTNATVIGGATGATAATSLGKWGSQQAVPSAASGLFGDVTSTINQAMTPAYRCITLWNNTSTGLTLTGSSFYFSGTAPAPAFMTGVVDATAATPIGSAVVTGNAGALLTTELTAPTGVTFPATGTVSTPTAYPGLTVGDVPPGSVRFVWLRREPRNSAAQFEVTSLEWDGDSGP